MHHAPDPKAKNIDLRGSAACAKVQALISFSCRNVKCEKLTSQAKSLANVNNFLVAFAGE
jgi:hypothetical protein